MTSEYVSLDETLKLSFTSMAFADMYIDCADGGVPVHRSVLAAASAFLRPLLREYNAVESNRIIVPDVGVETMKQVVSLIYTGTAFSTDIGQLQEIVVAAKLLGVELDSSWEIVNVVVLNAVSPKANPVVVEPEPEDPSSDELEIVNEVRKVLKPIPKVQRKRVRNKVTSETATVIGEMLESGQLQLTRGPGLRVNAIQGQKRPHPVQNIRLNGGMGNNPGVGMVRVHPTPFSRSEFQNISYSSPEYELVDEEEDYTMSQDEIQEAYLVASQKDHAYANGRGGMGKLVKIRVRSGTDLGYTTDWVGVRKRATAAKD